MKTRKVRLDDGKHYTSNGTGFLYLDDECKTPVKKLNRNGVFEDIETDIKVHPDNENSKKQKKSNPIFPFPKDNEDKG